MQIGQLRPWIVRQVDQYAPGAGGAGAVEVEAVVTDHHHLARLHLPARRQMQQASGMRLGRRLVAADHIVRLETVAQADGVQGQQRQLVGVAGEDAEASAAPVQMAHQLDGTGSGHRAKRQLAFVLQQPGVLGRGLVRR